MCTPARPLRTMRAPVVLGHTATNTPQKRVPYLVFCLPLVWDAPELPAFRRFAWLSSTATTTPRPVVIAPPSDTAALPPPPPPPPRGSPGAISPSLLSSPPWSGLATPAPEEALFLFSFFLSTLVLSGQSHDKWCLEPHPCNMDHMGVCTTDG